MPGNIDGVQCDGARPDLPSRGLQRRCFQSLTGLVVDLTGLSAAPPQDISSEKELWTPQVQAKTM